MSAGRIIVRLMSEVEELRKERDWYLDWLQFVVSRYDRPDNIISLLEQEGVLDFSHLQGCRR